MRFLPPLYAVVDTLGDPKLSHPDLAAKLVRGGVKFLQLRIKDLSSREFLSIAQVVHTVAQRYGALLIVNDRADIALAVNAAGVHLGQEDLPVFAARRILGREKMIGMSTHTVEQAVAAEKAGADYIGFGPLFPSTTKTTGYAPRGLEGLKLIRQAVSIPIVAIGGITEERCAQVLRAGADAVAIIHDIVRAEDITAKVQRVLQAVGRAEGCV